MQNRIENPKINQFIQGMLEQNCVDFIKVHLQAAFQDVQQKGTGLDAVFHINFNGNKTKFFVKDLLIELAAIDKNEEPLRYDEDLCRLQYFQAKFEMVSTKMINLMLEQLLFEPDFNLDDVLYISQNITRNLYKNNMPSLSKN